MGKTPAEHAAHRSCTSHSRTRHSLQMLQAVSVSLFCSRSVFRHYRVTQRDQGGYVIDVENPVSVKYLEINYNYN